jgi:TetR/AcrR family transcriptional repressor of lmrAB and yxaGH operons
MVRSTAELLRRQGYDGTGLSEILEESGAPRGSLYFHFPGGKDELAVEAVASEGAIIANGIELLLKSSDDVGEAVSRVVEFLAADLERSGYARGCPVAAVTLDSAVTSGPLREACRRAFDDWQALLEARLRRAGWKRRAAREEAILILSAVEGGLTLARAHRDPEPLRAVARRLRDELSRPPG